MGFPFAGVLAYIEHPGKIPAGNGTISFLGSYQQLVPTGAADKYVILPNKDLGCAAYADNGTITAWYGTCIASGKLYTIQQSVQMAGRWDNGSVVTLEANVAYNATKGKITLQPMSKVDTGSTILLAGNDIYTVNPTTFDSLETAKTWVQAN